MNRYSLAFISLSLTSVYALENQIGSNGVSGQVFTPNALISKGVFNFQYMDRNIGILRHQGYNFSSTFGLSESFEVGGRLSGNTWTSNLYQSDGGVRDLSASGKLQINSLIGLDKFPIKAAVGSVDYGGALTLYRSDYGVATYDDDLWQLSLGYAKALSNKNFNTISGPFASAATSLTPWVAIRFESSNKKTWAGFSLVNESIPKYINANRGTKFYLSWDAQISGLDMMGARPVLSVGVKLPLDGSLGQMNKENVLPAIEVNQTDYKKIDFSAVYKNDQNNKSLDQEKKVIVEEKKYSTEEAIKDQMLVIAKALSDQGFESIDVGKDEDSLVVQFSDFIFDHSNLDGVGVALGVLAENSKSVLDSGLIKYKLILSKWGSPSVGYRGDLQCLKNWLESLSCYQPDALQPQVRDLTKWLKSTRFEIFDYKSASFKPRIKINPVQNYYVGTEFGLIDYSIGVEMQTAVPLWRGGFIEFGEVFPGKSTSNYGDYKIFNFTKVRHGVEHTLVHHIERLNGGFSGRITAGQLFTGIFKGAQAEVRWESEGGSFESGLTTSYWKSDNMELERRIATPTVAFAKYAPSGKDWSFEMGLGEYWYKDKGLTLMTNHWFGDTLISMYLRRSVPPEPFWPGPLGATFAGFNVSFPLTPRKAMKPDYFQIKGTSQYGFNLGTPVGRTDNYIVGANGIPIYIKALADAPVASFLATDLLDHDRMNMSYLPFHMDRVRYAYLRWIQGKLE